LISWAWIIVPLLSIFDSKVASVTRATPRSRHTPPVAGYFTTPIPA
jgi:hypothetical protein